MDKTPLERLGDEIAELSAHLEAATARLLALIREFDARGGWNTGFRSCAAWLSWRAGLDLGAARERVRVARALATLPRLAEALGRGELSYAKVRAITRVATPETEEVLLGVGKAGTASHVERIVRGWRQVDRHAEAREAAQRHRARGVHVYQDDDGMFVIRGRLAPEVGALLVQALGAARETLYQRTRTQSPIEDRPSMAQQQADALGLLAETALHHGIDPGAPAERYQVVVHVDAPVLADPAEEGNSALEDGIRISAETSRRLACDASRVVMQHGRDGRVVEVAARTRTIPPAMRRALHHRDRRLPLPGLHCALRPGPSHPALGRGRPHDAVEPRAALSPAPPRRARGGLSRRTTARWRAPIPSSDRHAAAQGATVAPSTRRSLRRPTRTERRAGTAVDAPKPEAALARRAARSRLGHQRSPSPGEVDGAARRLTGTSRASDAPGGTGRCPSPRRRRGAPAPRARTRGRGGPRAR